jgi:hypothetical protein
MEVCEVQTIAERKARATMSDKEWFESGGASMKGYDFSKDATKDTIGNINDSQGDISPEAAMWAYWVSEIITDANGIGQWSDEICQPCHLYQLGCGCRTMEIKKQWVKKYDDDLAYIQFPSYKHARPISMDYIAVINGKAYWRKINRDCKNAHTYEQCAKQRIERWEFAQVCASLNLDAEYIRKRIKAGDHHPSERRRRVERPVKVCA